MLTDLLVTIVTGGIISETEKGIHPPYLYFTSKSLKLRTGYRRIKDGGCNGIVKFKKQPLFYFKYDERQDTCEVFMINNGVVNIEGFIPGRREVMRD